MTWVKVVVWVVDRDGVAVVVVVVVPMLQGQTASVYARSAGIESSTWWGHRAIGRSVPSAALR